MAGKRKAEGIALLSVYGGDDDDAASQASSADEEEDEQGEEEGETVEKQAATPQELQREESGNVATLQPDNAVEGSTLQSGETTANPEVKSSEAAEGEEVPESEAMVLDILNDFLPPIPTVKYSGELQTKFSKYLALKRTGKSLNEQLRNTKGYRNPDFLQSAVRHYDIDHYGSCFKKEVFDPHGYEQCDYFDSIGRESLQQFFGDVIMRMNIALDITSDLHFLISSYQWVLSWYNIWGSIALGIRRSEAKGKAGEDRSLEIRREAERKEQERRNSQRVDFVRSSIQASVAVAKPIIQNVHKVVTVSITETSAKAESRSSKRSKWDKVEVDGGRTTQSISNAVEAIAAANAHAAMLTASANAGAGYASFAQQRRREAEERLRASERAPLSGSSKMERKTERS